MKIEDFINKNVKVYDYVPKGYKKIEGAATQPIGYEWYSNNKSRFSGEYESCLVKVNYD